MEVVKPYGMVWAWRILRLQKGGTLDLVITNVTIIDPILGVIKADVGVKDGKIAGIGKAGNPNIMRGSYPLNW